MHRNLGMITAVAALVLTQQACAGRSAPESPGAVGPGAVPAPSVSVAPPEASSAAPSKTAAKKTTKAPGDPILAGRRQVVIKPVESFESIVVLDDDGALSLTDGVAEHSLFVLTPHDGRYQIRTAKVTGGGEPDCVGVKSNGTGSLTGAAAACDAGRDGQLFDIEPTGAKDNGLPTYSIANGGAFLQITRDGLILQELGDSPLLTTFSFVDNGRSTLPATN